MPDMMDYLAWRGDLALSKDGFNEVDGLVLSELSYIRWEHALPLGGTGMIRVLAPLLREKQFFQGFKAEKDFLFLPAVAATARFGTLTVTRYVHQFEETNEEQFAAVTFPLPDGSLFLSFRGTDGTVVGWKEDFNMAFSEPVPAQEDARKYLETIAQAYPDCPLRLGGHSKGGNLAMYAALSCDPAIRKRVIDIYNNDGPGLNPNVFPALYAPVAPRLHTFLPQFSVVGLLLANPPAYTVVESNEKGFHQHDPFTWQITGPRFNREKELKTSSLVIDRLLSSWLRRISEAERRTFVDALFDVIYATDSATFGKDMILGALKNPQAVIGAMRDLTPGEREHLTRALKSLASCLPSALIPLLPH